MGMNKSFESSNPSRDVYGNFNELMKDAYLVTLSEISPKDLKDSIGKIKDLITSGKITINQKGVSAYQVNSFHRFLVFTNDAEAIKPTKDDRRNVVIQCSDELCKKDSFGNSKPDEELVVINTYIKKIRSILDDVNAYVDFLTKNKLSTNQFLLLYLLYTEQMRKTKDALMFKRIGNIYKWSEEGTGWSANEIDDLIKKDYVFGIKSKQVDGSLNYSIDQLIVTQKFSDLMFINANFALDEFVNGFDSFLDSMDSNNGFVTEQGDIEDWHVKALDKQKIREQVMKDVEEARAKLNN